MSRTEEGSSSGLNQKPEITVTPLVVNFKNIPTGTLAETNRHGS